MVEQLLLLLLQFLEGDGYTMSAQDNRAWWKWRELTKPSLGARQYRLLRLNILLQINEYEELSLIMGNELKDEIKHLKTSHPISEASYLIEPGKKVRRSQEEDPRDIIYGVWRNWGEAGGEHGN